MAQVADDPIEAGREAARRRAWDEAYALLSAADEAGTLTGEGFELLAETAIWTGHVDLDRSAFERAYRAYLDEGNGPRAAFAATMLAHIFRNKLQLSVAAGWISRAARLLESEPESPEHGYLALERTRLAFLDDDLDAALEHARKAEEIGARFGDRNLEVRASQLRGMTLIHKGDLREGRALLDEATAVAAAGELNPLSTMSVYCNTIGTCRDLADFTRAGEWTDFASQWCDAQSASAFPGMCRVNRTEVMRFKGDWDAAEQQGTLASEELKAWLPRVAGAAFYEVGEVRLRRGDLAEAEKAFRNAHEYGRDPQPGSSLLRMAEGRVDAAVASMRRALADESGPLARARLLPAQVEIAVVAGDLRAARAAATELEEIATMYGTSALEASAAGARGAVELAEGDPAACGTLRRALRLWQEAGAPYETAKARFLLARAYREEGDEEAARLELEAAKSRFEQLRATRDVRAVDELLGGRAARTFMFTDIVDSTKVAEFWGEEKWQKQLKRHDDIVRTAVAASGGEVVKHTGDGFFLVFEDVNDAVESAIAIQRKLDEQGVAFDVRIGLHSGDAERADNDYFGLGVNAAQRIGALAGACEILASRDSVAGLALSPDAQPREVELKGFAEPVAVISIPWRY